MRCRCIEQALELFEINRTVRAKLAKHDTLRWTVLRIKKIYTRTVMVRGKLCPPHEGSTNKYSEQKEDNTNHLSSILPRDAVANPLTNNIGHQTTSDEHELGGR